MTEYSTSFRMFDKSASETRTYTLQTSVKGRRVKENIYMYSCAGGDSLSLTGCTKNRLLSMQNFFKLKVVVTFGIPTNLLARRTLWQLQACQQQKKKDHLEKNVVCKINSIIFRAVICMSIFQTSVGKDGVGFLH